MKNFMAKIVFVALFIFAASSANAQGILVPKSINGHARVVYVAVIVAGGTLAAALAAAQAEQNATAGIPSGATTGGQLPSGVTLAPGETVTQVGGATTYHYIPQW